MDGSDRVDRLVPRIALARGAGRLRHPTVVGYGIAAGRLCELVLAGALLSDRGRAVRSDRADAAPSLSADLQQVLRQVPVGGVPWDQLYWRTHVDVDATYRATVRWLVRHGIWRRRPLSVVRGRGYVERDATPTWRGDHGAGATRRQIAGAIVDAAEPAVSQKGSAAGPTADGLHDLTPAMRRAVLDVLAGLQASLALARRGGGVGPRPPSTENGMPGFTGIGT